MSENQPIVVEEKPKPSKPVKRKKKKAVGDNFGPKRFLTGYVRYMNDNREIIRQKNPDLNPVEITKLVAETWTKLPENEKKPYLDAAELDKERYNKEVLEMKNQKKNSAPEKEQIEEPAKSKENGSSSNDSPKIPSSNTSTIEPKKVFGNEIPIFTEEFLEHNKAVEAEVRLLRKSNIEHDMQISLQEKHIENLNNGIQKVNGEINSKNSQNDALEEYLMNLKAILSSAFHTLNIHGENPLDNIESYMLALQNMTKTNAHNATLNKAKEIIRKLDLKNLIK